MDYFNYQKGRLFADDVEVGRIAGEVGTPVYVYSRATFLEHLKKVQGAYGELDTTICYSVKACGNINILRFIADTGSGFDVVSGGELYRVQQAGADCSKVVFAGVGKTDKEIIEALNAEIGYFNIESESELENLIRLAKETSKTTKAALRVNPDIALGTHAYITTGVRETKFGVDVERAEKVFADYGDNGVVDLCAIHVHLGSGGKTVDPYCDAIKKVIPLVDKLRANGHSVEAIDLGGGFGADYESATVPSAADYASKIVPLLKGKDLKLILEPGKSICANAGILVTQVLFTKTSGSKKFVIVDAGMNDLIRPALYGAFHFIWPVKVDNRFVPERRIENLQLDGSDVVDVVGPICESGDFLAKDRRLPPVGRGDLLSVFAAGAYGFCMSSNYDARCRVAEVLVDGDRFDVIGRRETYDDLIHLEKEIE